MRPSKRLWWKKMWNPRWRPRNGCDGRSIVKILIMTIQVNLVPLDLGTKFTWIVVIKILPLTYHHSHFLAATLDFTSFFTIAFLRATHFFLQLGCFWLDFTSFCICMPQSWPMVGFGAYLTYSFFFATGRRKDEADIKYFKYFWIYQHMWPDFTEPIQIAHQAKSN